MYMYVCVCHCIDVSGIQEFALSVYVCRMCVCMYVCLCMNFLAREFVLFVCVYIHICMFVYNYTHMHIRMISLLLCMHTYMYIRMCANAHYMAVKLNGRAIHTNAHTYMYIRMCANAHYMAWEGYTHKRT